MTTKPFKQASKTQQEWKPGKYDTFKLVKLGDYRFQKGSARSICFDVAKDGMLVGTWTRKCCELGFEAKFPVNCVQKLMGAKEPGWGFTEKNAEGLTYEEVLHSRTEAKAKEKKEKKEKKANKKGAKPKMPKGVDSNGRVRKEEATAE